MKALKTTVLLLGPVLLIGFAGFVASRRSPALNSPSRVSDDKGQFSIELDEFSLVPITPREVELGFDAKAVAKYHFAGRSNIPPIAKGTGVSVSADQ